ncbi:MAG TPA: 30S ribosomal protein S6 [Candidatus Entotheonella sp.]|jgi:small subunit ribosomal protein S6
MSEKRIYETIFVLHPDLTDEDVNAGVQNTVALLESHGSEIIRTERGGKRRLAYPVEKQRYGFYSLIHFHGTNEALSELERMYRLNERVLRYLTVRFEKEEHLTGLTRMGDDDGRDEDRDDRRRGRRGDFQGRGSRYDRDDRGGGRYDRDDRGGGRYRDDRPPVVDADADDVDDEADDEVQVASLPVASNDPDALVEDAAEEVSEESH